MQNDAYTIHYMHMWFLCLDLFKRTRFLRFQSHNTWHIEIVLPHRIFVVNIYMIGQSGKVETESGQTTLKNLYHYLNSLDLHETRNAVFLCNQTEFEFSRSATCKSLQVLTRATCLWDFYGFLNREDPHRIFYVLLFF